tara:strand:+ start:786 stop:1538 length:753 start_codon:yes stop_codon:yes gene_type:complete
MEEDQNSEEHEVTPQDQESNVIDEGRAPEEAEQVEVSREDEDKQERNWRETRRKQRESDIKLKAQEELIEKLLNANKVPVQAPTPEPDEFADISSDDYPTWGQTDKRIEKRAEAIAEKKYRELEAKKEQGRFVERLQAKYTDFNDVVNPDSIATLEENEPELAATIADLKDPYKMGMQTYRFIKALGVQADVPGRRHAKEVEKKIEKNEKTIQSPQAYNKRPMAQAFQATEAEKSKLFEEMMGYAGGSGY